MYLEFIRNNPISKAAVRQFSQKICIARGIVVGRLQHDGHLPFNYLNDLKEKFEWVAL